MKRYSLSQLTCPDTGGRRDYTNAHIGHFMRRIRIFFLLFAIFMVSLVFCAQGADWVYVIRDIVGNEFFYDQGTLTKLPTGIIKVRSIEVYSDKGKKEYIQNRAKRGLNAMLLKKLNHTVDLMEIDCSTRGLRIMETSEHSGDGTVLEFSTFAQQPSEGWESISPSSTWERLYKAVCPSQNGR
jgi:hypothetical protein